MNILMLGRWVPPPRRPVRATREYQFARHLKRSHRLTLAFITDNHDAGGTISALRTEFGDLEFAAVPRGWKSLVSALRLASGESCTLSYARSEALRTRLADRLKSTPYGLVMVSSSNMLQYAAEIDPAIPLIIDFGDLDSEWWIKRAGVGTFPGTRFFRTEALRLRAAEAAGARRAAACVAASDAVAATIRGLAPDAPVTVIPNGVESDSDGVRLRPGKAPTVVFSAALVEAAELGDFEKFCRTVVPLVRRKMPAVRFTVLTRDRVRRDRPFDDLPGVEIVGPVTDIRPFLHSAVVAVAPLWSGADVRTSVLEPMAAGVPVVVTASACKRVDVQLGGYLDGADDPVAFARHVIGLLESEALRRQRGERGRELVHTSSSWDVYGRRLTQTVEDTLKRHEGAIVVTDTQKRRAALLG
jgi:polysaccharide biosynthesis protein PslH